MAKAAELDPDSADVHRLLADLDCYEWKWSEAEQEFRRAIALNPNSAESHDQFDTFLFAMGRRDEGVKEAQLAQELDPNGDYLGAHSFIRVTLKNPSTWPCVTCNGNPMMATATLGFSRHTH